MKKYRLNSNKEEDGIYDNLIFTMNDQRRGFSISPKLINSQDNLTMRSIYTYTDKDIIGIEQIVPNKLCIEYIFTGHTDEVSIRPYLTDINVYTNGILNSDESILSEKNNIIGKINKEIENESFNLSSIKVDVMNSFHINTTPYIIDLYHISLLNKSELKPNHENVSIDTTNIVLSIEKIKNHDKFYI